MLNSPGTELNRAHLLRFGFTNHHISKPIHERALKLTENTSPSFFYCIPYGTHSTQSVSHHCRYRKKRPLSIWPGPRTLNSSISIPLLQFEHEPIFRLWSGPSEHVKVYVRVRPPNEREQATELAQAPLSQGATSTVNIIHPK